jgi:hypothetical protein
MGNPKTEEALLIKSKLFRSTLVAALGALMFILSCNRECPVCPKPPTEPISDYDFLIAYQTPQGQDGIYVYNTAKRAITDSVLFPVPWLTTIKDIALNADGTRLLTLIGDTNYNQSFVVYNFPAMDTFYYSPINGTRLVMSNTGAYAAILGNELMILDATTFAVLLTDTTTMESGQFLRDDSKFYAIPRDNRIMVYDIMGESLQTVINYHERITTPTLLACQPRSDGKVIYLDLHYGSWYSHNIVSYYIEPDSTGFYYPMSPGPGDLQMTPDGDIIAFSDPGSMATEEYGTGNIMFLDPSIDRLLWISPAGGILTGMAQQGFEPKQLLFTPDSRYLFCKEAGGSAIIALIDLEKRAFVDINTTYYLKQIFNRVTCKKSRNN